MSKKNQSTAPVETSNTTAAAPEGFQSVSIDCPFYKPESNEGFAIQGAYLGRVQMPDTVDANGAPKAWHAHLFRATAETRGVTQDGEVVKINAGELVAVGESAALVKLGTTPVHPNFTIEFWMKPLAKKNLGGGKTFTPWDVRASRKPILRGEDFFDLNAILSTASGPALHAAAPRTNAPALPAAANGIPASV
jgi:hypothetical protein